LNATRIEQLQSETRQLEERVNWCKEQFGSEKDAFIPTQEENLSHQLKDRIKELEGQLPDKKLVVRDNNHGASMKDEFSERMKQFDSRQTDGFILWGVDQILQPRGRF
jgi:hypothetical protein